MQNNKEFAVSVADAIVRDMKTHQLVMIGKAEIDTSLKQAVQNKEVRGGFGNALQYEFAYNKVVSCEISSSTFKEEYIAMNNGVPIVNEMAEYWNYGEKIKITSQSFEVKDIPVSDVYVELPNKTIETITPVGKTVRLKTPVEVGETVICSYRVKDVIDTIVIDTQHYPIAYELTLIARIFDASGQTKEMQVEIPEWKVEGNFEINLKADDVTVPKISGKALDHNGVYARIHMKRVNGQEIPVQQLVSSESEIELAKGEKIKPQFLGIRGSVYGNVPISLERVEMTSEDPLKVKVNKDGTIEGVAKGTSKITVKLKDNENLTDVIVAECVEGEKPLSHGLGV